MLAQGAEVTELLDFVLFSVMVQAGVVLRAVAHINIGAKSKDARERDWSVMSLLLTKERLSTMVVLLREWKDWETEEGLSKVLYSDVMIKWYFMCFALPKTIRACSQLCYSMSVDLLSNLVFPC